MNIFELISSITTAYPLLTIVLVTVVLVSFLLVVGLFLVGFIQKRSISIWPPKIGEKPVDDIGSCRARFELKEMEKEDSIDMSSIKNQSFETKQDRTLVKNLERKLIVLAELEDAPFVLLGSTYLDVILSPISTTTLAAEEWSDLAPIKITIGGSAMCVGRYLFADYQKKSYLLTQVSDAKDMFSKEFRKLLKREQDNWIVEEITCCTSKESSPVTVLLKQLDQSYTTMFTHRGVLTDFNWDAISSRVSLLLTNGGVLYLSGFIKTNLSASLVDNLKKFHSKSLICLDHGRLNLRTDNPSALKPIYEAFSVGLIDVYICTISELSDFLKIVTGNNVNTDAKDTRAILEGIAESELLPPVTIVRNTVGEKSILAFSVVGGAVDSISDHSRRWFDNTPVAPLNAFNAAVIHYFSTEPLDSADDLRGHTIRICQKALDACHKVRSNDPSAI